MCLGLVRRPARPGAEESAKLICSRRVCEFGSSLSSLAMLLVWVIGGREASTTAPADCAHNATSAWLGRHETVTLEHADADASQSVRTSTLPHLCKDDGDDDDDDDDERYGTLVDGCLGRRAYPGNPWATPLSRPASTNFFTNTTALTERR